MVPRIRRRRLRDAAGSDSSASIYTLMKATPKIVPKPIIIAFFLLGLLSSLAFRVIILLQQFRPDWVRPVWYFGVIGYMLFFVYRYRISARRKGTIAQTGLIEKLGEGSPLTVEDREAALYLLNSIRKSPEDWNYLGIFILSIAAIALDAILWWR